MPRRRSVQRGGHAGFGVARAGARGHRAPMSVPTPDLPPPDLPPPDLPPIVQRLDALSRKQHSRCGRGSMVWRRWGAGPIVVLLHGGYGAWTHWIRNIEPLAASRTVIAPDMPGLGDSAMPEEPYSAESLAAVMVAGLTQLLPADATIQLVG